MSRANFMRKLILFFSSLGLILLILIVFPIEVKAVELSVEAPQEQLTRGQVFDWKVNIDTQGESVSKQEFYFTYDTQYLELQSFLAGDFFDNVSYSKLEAGKLYVVAESTTAKSGSGLVAVGRMKIIAQAPGSSQLCAVIPITPTPSGQPTPTGQLTTTPGPTSVYLTTTPLPTRLPTSGGEGQLLSYTFLSLVFLGLAVAAKTLK